MDSKDDIRLAIIGMGYVGLPLAVEFGKYRPVVGFDVDRERVAALQAGEDHSREVSQGQFEDAQHLRFSFDEADLKGCNCFVVSVPTPIDQSRRPDLKPLLSASATVGRALPPGGLVIFESTVYPGCTEDKCVPIIEEVSGLRYAKNCTTGETPASFHVGYSPERINPGDQEHRLVNIVKVTSGSCEKVATLVDELYREIVRAGTHRAPSIAVAEAAKVIENTQRDLNIALINELAKIFDRLNIDTEAVLQAAETKWNFLPFRPGLVGGHCIGVDPYYLTYCAEMVGYSPDVILAGRKVNDSMGFYVANRLLESLATDRKSKPKPKILIMGVTFKENCPDIRNTKVIDIYRALLDSGCDVDIYDPWVSDFAASKAFGLRMTEKPEENCYDGIVLAVAHGEFKDMGVEKIRRMGREGHILFDLKYIFDKSESDLRL